MYSYGYCFYSYLQKIQCNAVSSAILFFSFGGHVFTASVCFAGLSAGLHENYGTDFRVTWMEDGSRPRMDAINLLCGAGYRDRSRIFFI